MLLAMNPDITAWRTASDFMTRYREALLARMARCDASEALRLLDGAEEELRHLADEHRHCREAWERINADLNHCTGEEASNLAREGFALLYRHFGLFRSAPVFYRMAEELLAAICTSIHRQCLDDMGLLSRRIPAIHLFLLGPSGRGEFSPLCPLQLGLIHEDDSQVGHEAIVIYCRLLHERLEAYSLPVDREISPHSSHWRGTSGDWRQRLAHGLESAEPETLIELLRLSDLTPLTGDTQLLAVFRSDALGQLRGSHAAMANLAHRLRSLSNGLGLLGRLKTEKIGEHRSMFALRDNALIPLSATIGAMTLASGGAAGDTPRRIRELLELRHIDVDMAERLLKAWHTLNELRLEQERQAVVSGSADAQFLDIDLLGESLLEELHDALETIGVLQRQALMFFAATVE